MTQSRLIVATLFTIVAPLAALVTPAAADELSAVTCDATDRCRLTGQITDKKSGEPVIGAFVSGGDADDSTSALTDENGVFVLQGVARGKIEIAVVADTYEPFAVQAFVSTRSQPLRLELTLEAEASGEVVFLSDKAPNMAKPRSYEMDGADIRVLPGSGNDALAALQSLPGVARVPLGLGGLVLRGASPRDSNVFLDGVEVPLLFHFGGLASFMPSAMLDSMELVPGGFSSRYGRAQGGIVELTSKPGRRDRWRVASQVSLLDAQVRAEGPAFGGGSWTMGVRRSYVDAILTAAIPDNSDFDLTIAPRYYDAQLRYDVDLPSSKGVSQKLSAMIFASDDRMRFLSDGDSDDPEGNRFDYVSSFARAAIRYRRNQGNIDFSLSPWVGIDQSSLRFNEQGITRTSMPFGGRGTVTGSFKNGYLAGGLDVQGARVNADINNEPPAMPGAPMDGMGDGDTIQRNEILWYSDTAFWLEGLYRFDGGKLGIKPGARIERYGLTNEWVIDPRINVSQKFTDWFTLEESFGLFHQPPNIADLDPLTGNANLGSSYSVQASIGAKVEPARGVKASVTGFYDQMNDLPVDVVTQATSAASPGSSLSGGVAAISREFTSEQFGTYSYQENVGRGRNFGAEFMLEARGGAANKAGSFLAWLSYTYSRALRRDDPTRYFSYRPYVLDQPHVITALGTVQLTDNWRLGARIRYATGNPYTPVSGTFFDADEQEYRSISGALLSQRLPAFFQFDVRIDRQWKRKWGTIGLFLDVQNASNRTNAEGVSYNFDFTETQYTRGLPVFPSLGVEYIP